MVRAVSRCFSRKTAFRVPGRMTAPRWYRLAEGSLGVVSADRALAERFEEIYEDCAEEAPGLGPRVVCRVSAPESGVVRISFDDPEPLDAARFIETVFPERGYALNRRGDGRVALSLPDGSGDVLLKGDSLIAPETASWQALAANLAVSRLLRLQRALLFFHAASVRVGGEGLMACGPKRSGKTTLALSLAARGHALLGDEIAAIHVADRTLQPFRRSLATREGPSSAAAAAIARTANGVQERFPDGEIRTRLTVRRFSPCAPPATTPLTTVLLLRSFLPTTRIRRPEIQPALLGALTPLAASLWERPPSLVAFRLLAMLSAVRVFEIDSGPPDEVADRIEHLMEES